MDGICIREVSEDRPIFDSKLDRHVGFRKLASFIKDGSIIEKKKSQSACALCAYSPSPPLNVGDVL